MEAGWVQIERLQFECGRQRAASGVRPDQRLVHLLGYVEAEVVGIFSDCVAQASRLVPPRVQAGSALDALWRLSERFERAVVLSGLLSDSPRVPLGPRTALEQVSATLIDWAADFGALAAVVGADAPAGG
ncbi:MAG TPA: hypothetical protein VFQ45_23265 [Longimicrobium sp.]|nr:hypothetical protein [Longimicrobium sp.]